MFSIPKSGGAVLALSLLIGCNSQPMQRVQNRMDTVRSNFVARIRPSQNQIDSVQVDPPADEAAQIRGWDTSTFVYPSGAVLAYPTYGLNYEDRPKWLSNDYVYSLALPAIIVYDVFAMPVYMIVEPPGTAVTYHGARQPASMTIAVPMQTPAQARQQQIDQERARREKESEPGPQGPPDQPQTTPDTTPQPTPPTPPGDQPVKPETTPAQPDSAK